MPGWDVLKRTCRVMWPDALDLFGLGTLGVVEVPAELQAEPEVRGSAEEPGQSQGGAGCDAAFPPDDCVDALVGHLNRAGQIALGHPKGLEKLL